MSTTLTVILLIVLVLAVGFMREGRRTGAVNRWAKNAGFTPVPTAEHDRERLDAWAERFRPANVAQWGNVLRGDRAGLETIIAEHHENRTKNADRWFTLVIMRVPGLKMAAVRITRAPAHLLKGVIQAAVAPGVVVRHRLGFEVTEQPVIHPVGAGTWAVEVVNNDALAFWSSPTQAAAIDAWPHDAELAAGDDHVLVRVPGLIAAGRLDELLAIADAARALFTQASGRG